MQLYDKVENAAEFIASFIEKKEIDVAIVTGTGLGGLLESLDVYKSIPYGEIPHFPQTSVGGHEGFCHLGTLGDKTVMLLQGRFHYYEGHEMDVVTFPIRIFKRLGVENIDQCFRWIESEHHAGRCRIGHRPYQLTSSQPHQRTER